MKTGNKSIDTQEHKENFKNTRKSLKVLQHTAQDKENLTGRILKDKDAKLASISESKRKKAEDKAVQVGENVITAADLTSDDPGLDYWKSLAEKRESQLEESFKENERLNSTIESLQEENRICKEMLDESRHLVEVLQEMLSEEDEVAQQAVE